MAQIVEIRLRIPSLRVPSPNEAAKPTETVVNGDVRFIKRLELEAIPKPGDVLTMAVSSGDRFNCVVTRSDWDEQKNMFVVACRYSNRSISRAEYQALM